MANRGWRLLLPLSGLLILAFVFPGDRSGVGQTVSVQAEPAADHMVYLPCILNSGPAGGDDLVFAVVGDYGSGSDHEAEVAALVDSWVPEFIITTGDNNYDTGSAATIDAHIGQYYHSYIGDYTGAYGEGAVTNLFFPSLGNHDWLTADAQPYLDYFNLPGNERYYSFTWGSIAFFAIDSDPTEPDGVADDSAQAAWLENALVNSTACWNIVYFHHAPYSSGSHGSITTMQWPFEAWGADAVLSGHDHTYERLTVGSIPYFVNGIGGKSLYTFGTPLAESQARFNGSYGAMRVTATTISIIYELISVDGLVQDSFLQVGGCE